MYCRKCRYPLDGLSENRCPECGRAFDPQNPSTWHSETQLRGGKLRKSEFAGLSVAGGLYGVFGTCFAAMIGSKLLMALVAGPVCLIVLLWQPSGDLSVLLGVALQYSLYAYVISTSPPIHTKRRIIWLAAIHLGSALLVCCYVGLTSGWSDVWG